MTKGIKKLDENVISPFRSLTITNPSLPDNTNWQIGTLKCDPANSGLTYKIDNNGNFSKFDARFTLLDETITSELIKNGTIRTEDLADSCVTNDKIQDRTINHIKLQQHTLTDDEMGAESVSTRALKRQCIVDSNDETISKIASKTILNRSLSDSCIEYRNMSSDSVGTLQLINGAVTTNKYGFESLSNEKIIKDTIQWNKIAPHTIIGGENTEAFVNGEKVVVKGRIAQKTITNWNIADNTINSLNIMTGAITNEKIGDLEVYGNKIAPLAIQNSHIGNKAIDYTKISDNGIKTINYDNGSVTKEKLANDVLYAVNNAVVYDNDGNVKMIQDNKTKCDVVIGSGSIEGGSRRSDANGSLNVYGSIQADRVYNMAYADLAEAYIPGEKFEAGEAAFIREDGKVYRTGLYCVGVVSDEYAMCFGASEKELKEGSKVPVALIGKVHVKTDRDCSIGCNLYSSLDNGCSRIGIAIENKTLNKNEKYHKVLCLVRPN